MLKLVARRGWNGHLARCCFFQRSGRAFHLRSMATGWKPVPLMARSSRPFGFLPSGAKAPASPSERRYYSISASVSGGLARIRRQRGGVDCAMGGGLVNSCGRVRQACPAQARPTAPLCVRRRASYAPISLRLDNSHRRRSYRHRLFAHSVRKTRGIAQNR